MHGHLLAIDVGSSSVKVVAFDRSGAIVETAACPVETHSWPDGRQEQDAQAWWRALVAALSGLGCRASTEAVVLTGSMQNLIPLDRSGKPLGPAVLYSDRRLGEGQVAELAALLPADYASRVGNRLDPAHTILKLMRLPRFAPGVDRDGAVFQFGAKDALSLRMTGVAAVDPTTASTTGLMDFSQHAWDGELLRLAGVGRESLPAIRAADAVVGLLLPQAAEALGLPAGIPVFNGAGDAAAATWGAEAGEPGAAYLYLGTTGWVAATLPLESANPPRDTYTLADPIHPDRAIVVAPFLTAGAALDWMAGAAGQGVAELLRLAEAEDAAPPAALFLPYLQGERSPFEDARVRGAFLGLDRAHGAGAMGYAVCEGIAFAVRHNLEAFGAAPAHMTVIGGGAKSALQRQILADVLNRSLLVPDEAQETTALGAMRMVAPALKLEIAHPQGTAAVIEPRAERAKRHAGRFEAYLAASRFARELGPVLG